MFHDKIHLLVQAGSGGNGCESVFRRSDRKVIHNGGDGGKGGNVIFRADVNAQNIGSLKFKQHLIAGSGGHGGSNHKRGKNGDDLVVLVPVGTGIYDRERNFLIRELNRHGEEVVVVEGGGGGSGNFGGKEYTPGERGKALEVELRLLLPADVFLVGLPNSGKTKFLNTLTRTKAKDESYPFATKSPEIGVWKYSDYEQMTICELPSIYAASHDGRGRGTEFLKHLERARLILYMVDPASEFAPSAAGGFELLRKEVGAYSEEFLKKPSAVVVNKMDLDLARKQYEADRFQSGLPVFAISALSGEGLDALQAFMIQCVEKSRGQEAGS